MYEINLWNPFHALLLRIHAVPIDEDTFGLHISESQLGRIVIGVEALHEAEVCQALEQHGLTLIGLVVSGGRLVVEDGFDVLIDLEVEEMVEAWKAPLALPVGGGR